MSCYWPRFHHWMWRINHHLKYLLLRAFQNYNSQDPLRKAITAVPWYKSEIFFFLLCSALKEKKFSSLDMRNFQITQRHLPPLLSHLSSQCQFTINTGIFMLFISWAGLVHIYGAVFPGWRTRLPGSCVLIKRPRSGSGHKLPSAICIGAEVPTCGICQIRAKGPSLPWKITLS